MQAGVLLTFHSHGVSTIGRRPENQGRFIADDGLKLYAAVNGLGGRGRGKMARIIADAVVEYIRERPREMSALLPSAIESAYCRALDAIRDDQQLEGMGATIISAATDRDRLIVARVGDCRLYRLRDGFLAYLEGSYDTAPEEEIWTFPVRKMVVVNEFLLEPEDRYLLCTSTLTKSVSRPMIYKYLATGESPESVCWQLMPAEPVTLVVFDVRSVAIHRGGEWYPNASAHEAVP